MHELRGKHIIGSLQKKWSLSLLLARLLILLSVSLLLTAISMSFFYTSWWLLPIIWVVLTVVFFAFFFKSITEADVAKFLNKAIPELQESTELYLQEYENLNFLQKLQLQKIEPVFDQPFLRPKKITKQLSIAWIIFLGSLAALIISILLPAHPVITRQEMAIQKIKEVKLPEVGALTLTITPPAYTRRQIRKQDKFNVAAEEGASLVWHIRTTITAKEISLVFNDKSVLSLHPLNEAHTEWSISKQIKTSGFYQLSINSNLSELYRVEMIKDALPVISVQSPKPNTLIEPGQPQKALLTVSLSDDYGIQNSSVFATVASGSGEAVKFKTQQLAFSNFTAGNTRYQLQKTLDLPALGMKAGDELYFYISATDAYNQEKRSDIYIIRIEDTAQLMSMNGLVSGTDIKPEFFRSERQIIIETEQLLREKDTISAESFKTRSNDLGIDQKLLRLRYGKFLGQESDAEEHDHKEAEQNSAADFGNAQKMIDEVSHKHDNAEDATFFDAQTKKQLKATLDEMWKAELQLRTIQPKDALPFEYKALKLLKDLQQQTRAFVSKTGSKTTPLKPEKRLTGELDKIIEPVQQQNFQQAADENIVLRKALGILTLLQNKEPVPDALTTILQEAAIQLSAKAAAEPAVYLSALSAMEKVVKNKYTSQDLLLSGKALQKMIGGISQLPLQQATAPDGKLSEQYFINLNNQHE